MSQKRNLLAAFAAACFMLVPSAAQSFRASPIEVSPFGGGTFYRGVQTGPGSKLSTGGLFGGRVGENLGRHFGLEQSVGYNLTQFNFITPVPGVAAMAQGLDTRVLNANFDGLYHFRPNGARVRPFLAGGIGGARFTPRAGAKDFFRTNSIKPTGQLLREETRGQYNYGGGVKIRFTDLLGMRADVRGLLSRNPTFGMQTVPNGQAFIPNGNWLSAIEATAGLVFNLGGAAASAPYGITVSRLTADPAAAGVGAQGVTATNLLGLTAENSVCAGTPVKVNVVVTDAPKGHLNVYHWSVNGMSVNGDANTFNYTPAQPGVYQIGLQVTDTAKKPAAPVTATPINIYARDCRPHQLAVGAITAIPPGAIVNGTGVVTGTPVRLQVDASDPLGHKLAYKWTANGQPIGGDANNISFTPTQAGQTPVTVQITDTDSNAAPAGTPAPVTIYARDNAAPAAVCSATNGSLTLGQTTALRVVPSVAQGNMARIRWTLSEGSVSDPASATPTFNSTGVVFPASAQSQTKTIRATATVTDDSGRSASCTTNLSVTLAPAMVHYGDIVFGEGSARINNCAKRILIERVYPQLTSTYQGYTLVLVGHIDPSEKTKDLDRKRVLDAAAVLSANFGKPTPQGSCTALEPTRIKGDWVATTATEYKETSCGVSFDAANAERAADRVKPNDARTRNRRVEIWLVPPGQAMPASVREAHNMPLQELQKLGCPR